MNLRFSKDVYIKTTRKSIISGDFIVNLGALNSFSITSTIKILFQIKHFQNASFSCVTDTPTVTCYLQNYLQNSRIMVPNHLDSLSL